MSNYVSEPKISKWLPQNTHCTELLIPAFQLRAGIASDFCSEVVGQISVLGSFMFGEGVELLSRQG